MPQWSMSEHTVPGGRRFELMKASGPLRRDELLRLLATDAAFIAWYAACLVEAPFDAFFWEHPPLTKERLDRPAEFVLMDAPALAGTAADPRPFGSHFEGATGDIVRFRNLGGDALLVVPCPVIASETYAHLAVFLRDAPSDQVRRLFRDTAESVRRCLGSAPLWLSTSGTGVAWLHVRLDERPKYYQYRPYREWP